MCAIFHASAATADRCAPPQVKDIFKERAALERDYALKLQALARRGQEKKGKLMTALLVGDTPTKAWGEDTIKKRCVCDGVRLATPDGAQHAARSTTRTTSS